MADDTNPPAEPNAWQEREIASALQRLANARANVAVLEEHAVAPVAEVTEVAADDADRLESLHSGIERLRPKTTGRFGAGSARHKMDELELEQRLLLDRLGFASYDAYRAGISTPSAAAPTVDATMLEFARREFRDAEAAFIEITSMIIPPSDPEPVYDDEDGDHDAEIIDLQAKPSAAS